MPTTADIKKVSNFIEENTRTSKSSGIKYIDPRNHRSRVLLKQNHVIFGRRGAGKSSLIKTIRENPERNYHFCYINLEDFKGITFPNILIHVLQKFQAVVCKSLKSDTKFYQLKKRRQVRNLCKALGKAIASFSNQLNLPDTFDESVKTKSTSASSTGAEVSPEPIKLSASTSDSTEVESAKTLLRNKLDALRNSIPTLKAALANIAKVSPSKPVFLLLDDLYFLPKEVQLGFVDFFHTLTKDTPLFLKIATIRHRSQIGAKSGNSYIGTEIGHDISEIDLDYNLNRFEELKDFMRSLIGECAKECGVTLDLDEIFSAGGFVQLCLASGGVPRDFLTLFVRVSSNFDEDSNRRISKPNITETAIQNLPNKYASLGTDSVEEKEVLESYLAFIKEKIIREKRTNMFLVSNTQVELKPQSRQAIKELIDLRMLHLVEPDTSASGGDRQRFSAYMIDISLYPSPKQHDFRQLDPGVTDDAGRKDEMRGAPKLNLDELEGFVQNQTDKQIPLFD